MFILGSLQEIFPPKMRKDSTTGIIENWSLPQGVSTRHPWQKEIKGEEEKRKGNGNRWRKEYEKQSEILFGELFMVIISLP